MNLSEHTASTQQPAAAAGQLVHLFTGWLYDELGHARLRAKTSDVLPDKLMVHGSRSPGQPCLVQSCS